MLPVFRRTLSNFWQLSLVGELGRTSTAISSVPFRSPIWRSCYSKQRHSCAKVDTVFALSSGHGKCGVSVIRLSGPSTEKAVRALLGDQRFVKPRKASLRRLYHPEGGYLVDEALILWFPGPQSFTGEDSAELHVHGSLAVVNAVYSALSAISHLKMADPGDFTRRAFLHHKLDLTAVEGLADLIHSETEAQRRQALRQLQGDLGRMYSGWSQRLLKCLADVEAVIDFGEDDGIGDELLEKASQHVRQLTDEMSSHLHDRRCGERLRSGVHLVIVGAPNVGKSSLLNFLCQRPAAIVSSIPGTTRDVLNCSLNLDGYPVILSDTAGLRDTTDPIEQEGVRRATQQIDKADLTVVVLDASSDLMTLLPLYFSLLEPKHDGSQSLLVVNKMDLVVGGDSIDQIKSQFTEVPICTISCKTNEGTDQFLEMLTKLVKELCGNPLAGNPSLTQARHRHHLQKCLQSMSSFHEQTETVLAAEELRLGLGHLGQITGKVGAEDILDVIFRDFCIGK